MKKIRKKEEGAEVRGRRADEAWQRVLGLEDDAYEQPPDMNGAARKKVRR